jgi:glycerate-2-kinase
MVAMLPTPTQRARTRTFLQRLFLGAVAHMNPSERTAQALAAAGWRPARTVIVAAGKSALAMASGAVIHLTEHGLALAGGLIVVTEHTLSESPFALGFGGMSDPPVGSAGIDDSGDFQRSLEISDSQSGDSQAGAWPMVCSGGHPVPDHGSVLAATSACKIVAEAPPDSEVLVLLSGGASALMALPAPGLSLQDKITVVNAVAASGADRRTVNMVRKHLSAIKGGRLATMSSVPMTTLIASDVVGDDLTAVASGPTLPDPTTIRQACDVVAATMGWGAVPWRVRAHFDAALAGARPDTPKRGRAGDRVALLAGTGALVDAAVALAQESKLVARAFARDLVGDASVVAQRIAVQARRAAAAGTGTPMCFAGGGEPTVVLPANPGVGGRAQQVALMVAREITGIGGVTVLVAASDGIDGNSDAAGAVVDGYTWDSVIAAGIDPERALARCDAGTALGAIGASVVTGGTEINHGDLVLIAAGM